jgi:DNA-directed RNA polymerase subunit RPC12/RpoP
MNYCPECGAKLEPEWKNCPNCGSRVTVEEESFSRKPQPIQYTPQVQYNVPREYYVSRDQSNVYGIVSLIFGILGIIVLPFIGAIIALIFGSIGKKRDANPSLANIGSTLGIIGLCCSCCLVIIPFMLIPTIYF